jgi:GNAT superfamily N-acetyltransferase
MSKEIEIRQVTTRRERLAFIKFSWRVYKDDPNWVPPLIFDQLAYLDPQNSNFFNHADAILLTAHCNNEINGTIAAFVDHRLIEHPEQQTGGFGFFEVIEDYDVAKHLLDAACEWLRARGITLMRGPTSFTENDNPGVLIEGTDCPPVMLEAHTPLYYKEFLERYGMEKDHDLFAWRAFRSQIGDELKNIPPDLARVAEVARKATNITIRKFRLNKWDDEIDTVLYLFNTTLNHLPDFNPMTKLEFQRLADRVRPFIDPDLALFAEIEGKSIGFCIAVPDINRVLIHLNGRLFPFGWLKIRRLIKQIDVVTFKLMGVLEEYRHRGIDALLYLEAIKAIYEKGYVWLDGSVTSEYNPMVNLLAHRLGAERYKHYRIYQMKL